MVASPALKFVRADPDSVLQVFYDPMIAKLIVHGSNRTEALRVLRKALAEYQIVGPQTNIEFLKRLSEHEAFIAGDVETGFIQVRRVRSAQQIPVDSAS